MSNKKIFKIGDIAKIKKKYFNVFCCNNLQGKTYSPYVKITNVYYNDYSEKWRLDGNYIYFLEATEEQFDPSPSIILNDGSCDFANWTQDYFVLVDNIIFRKWEIFCLNND